MKKLIFFIMLMIIFFILIYFYLPKITAREFNGGQNNSVHKLEVLDQDEIWSKKVLDGGYYLHFRHGNRNRYIQTSRTPETDVTGFDGIALALGLDEKKHSFKSITCLTDNGINESKLVKLVFEKLNLKISKIFTSPSCRAKETSFYAFGNEGVIVNSLLHHTAMPKKQRYEASLILKKILMAEDVKKGELLILSGHNATLDHVIIDINQAGNLDDRDDLGFVVIEKVNGKLIARHLFKRFRDFSTNVIQVPLTP